MNGMGFINLADQMGEHGIEQRVGLRLNAQSGLQYQLVSGVNAQTPRVLGIGDTRLGRQ